MGDCCDNIFFVIVHDPLTTTSKEGIFLQDFPVSVNGSIKWIMNK